MFEKLLDELTEDYLDEEQLELAECIGIESYRVLLKTYSGFNLYIQKIQTILIPIRDKHIRKEFNGGNYKALAKKYSLSERSVRRIINS